ncbi:MAG TPA: hypothetical protein VJ810_42480 [Blastocatellia bacterium]|nr:hypothetical protein [Blastocatellia bacterium]
MSPEFENKLLELMNEAQDQRLPAVHVVLHMLIGCHTNGTQAEFAKWCCQFNPFQTKIQFAPPEAYEEFPTELNTDE